MNPTFPLRSAVWRVGRAWLFVAVVALALAVGLQLARPAAARADLNALNKPTNIACLPFAQPVITKYNGESVTGNFSNTPDQTFVTWRDESDTETQYVIERRVNNGAWVLLAILPADSTYYADAGLEDHDGYFYRVRAEGGGVGQWSDECRKPSFLDSDEGNFRIFYRPHLAHCPSVLNLEGEVGTMCASHGTALRMADMLELSYAWILQYDFPDPVTEPPLPVDLTLCDGNGCVRSFEDRLSFVALNPGTMATPFDLDPPTNEHALRVPRHELFHVAQQGITQGGDGEWITEGTARSTDDKICLDPPACDLSLDTFPGSYYHVQAEGILLDPNRTLFETSYHAALFWTYISEQYGQVEEEPQRGLDFFTQLWVSGNAHAHTHGRQVIDFTLADMGYSDTFEDVFKNFVVANYAKDLDYAPAHYRYIDEGQNPGSYGSVALTANQLLLGGQYIAPGEDASVVPWGARYYRFAPAHSSAVPTIAVQSETLTGNNVYYTLLAVDDETIVQEINHVGSSFNETIPNLDFDEVVVIVAGLGESSNFTLAVNADEPELRIVEPLQARPAAAGDPTEPEKVLVKVEVVDPAGGGTPIAGLDPASFDIAIGGVPVDPDQIIASSYIQGQYWLLVRAPDQPGGGKYDLVVANDTVAGGVTLSDTEAEAVRYTSAIESDNLIVGDRSGSMADGDKLEAAQDAARLYVDSWEAGDEFGVVSYENTATVDFDLQPWDDISRGLAFGQINGWTAFGGTGIGNALLTALQEFDDESDDSRPWNLILLSDGMETVEEPNLQDFVDAYLARPDAADPLPVPEVYVVALGADADQGAMQQLACDTGGCENYHFAGEAGALAPLNTGGALHNELAEIYRYVAARSALRQQTFAAHGQVAGGQAGAQTLLMDGSVRHLSLSVNWVQETLNVPLSITVQRPDGVAVAPSLQDSRHRVYNIANPMVGEWRVIVQTLTPSAPTYDYLVEATVASDLTMELFLGLPPEERRTGTPMPILVSLSDEQPVVSGRVTAVVVDPSDTTHEVSLYDDGLHGDGAASDGFYGGTFYRTATPGSYTVVATATGTAPLHGDYTRRQRTSFYLDGGEDSDGDGLPGHYETDRGLDPETPDPTNSDPDGDGLFTFTEFGIGTHPLDPDTDNGGESDGSEHARGANPLDNPQDDGVQPPMVTGWTGAGQLWLVVSPQEPTPAPGGRVRVFSGSTDQGPWTLVADNLRPATTWHHDRLRNGTEQCYRVVLVAPSGAASGSSNVTCMTPSPDPIAPEGHVVINRDAPTTNSRRVQLSLRATDVPEDAHHDYDGQPPVHEEAQISGVAQVMVSNRPDFQGARWVPYRQNARWTLEPEGNLATVYVRFRDHAGNESLMTSDAILFGRP